MVEVAEEEGEEEEEEGVADLKSNSLHLATHLASRCFFSAHALTSSEVFLLVSRPINFVKFSWNFPLLLLSLT